MTTKLKENIAALFIAILLTWWVILALNSSSNLATDILWEKKIDKTISDVNVINKDNTLEIISNKNISNVSSISLELLFNKEKVSINRDNLDSTYNLSATEKEGWNGYTIIIQNIGEIKKGDVLLNIDNITKEQFDNINIGHIQIINNNWVILNLRSLK